MLKTLRTEIQGCSLFCNKQLVFDFTASKKVSEEEIANNEINRVDGLIDKQNVLALVGSNATGKTTQLKIIKMMIGVFLSLESINDYSYLSNQFEKEFKLTNYFYANEELYRLESFIEKHKDGSFSIMEEIVSSKRIYVSHKKNDLFEFDLTKKGEKELLRRV